jgi:2,3-bisphosphoglycerate-independent phosphoglycerate mutase
MGITLQDDETAFRCNLVTLDQTDNSCKMLDYSAGHISTQEAKELIESVQKHCGTEQFRFHAGINYRHILVVKGAYPDMQPVPPHDYIGKDVSSPWHRYMENDTWKQLITCATKVLASHPVNQQRTTEGKNPGNGIWLWGEGKLPSMPTLQEQYGITGGLISAVDLLKGLGVNAGLEVINIPGATGYIDTNYKGKADAALKCLEDKDFVFVHVEAPDEAGHQGSLPDKLQAIEDFDSKITAPIIQGLRAREEDFRVIATMDHYTPLSLRTHIDTPVPVLLYDSKETNKGSGVSFTEENGNELGTKPNGTLPDGESMMKKLLQRQ